MLSKQLHSHLYQVYFSTTHCDHMHENMQIQYNIYPKKPKFDQVKNKTG